MLLIGQPKSATTSFMWSLAHIIGIAHKNGQSKGPKDKPCNEYIELQKYHNTMVMRSYAYLLKYITAKDVLYKEHILPVEDHTDFIQDIGKPVIVLVRNPVDSANSYKRVLSVLPDIKVDFKKIEDELNCFMETYLELEIKFPNVYKVITFKDVVNDFTETVKKCILHYGLKVPKNVDKYTLCKRNYTYR